MAPLPDTVQGHSLPSETCWEKWLTALDELLNKELEDLFKDHESHASCVQLPLSPSLIRVTSAMQLSHTVDQHVGADPYGSDLQDPAKWTAFKHMNVLNVSKNTCF